MPRSVGKVKSLAQSADALFQLSERRKQAAGEGRGVLHPNNRWRWARMAWSVGEGGEESSERATKTGGWGGEWAARQVSKLH